MLRSPLSSDSLRDALEPKRRSPRGLAHDILRHSLEAVKTRLVRWLRAGLRRDADPQ
jgi:hypothetical protein